MIGKIHLLHQDGYVANDNATIAAKLRALADSIEDGERGQVEKFVGVMTSDQPLHRVCYGKAGNIAEIVGILTMAAIAESVVDPT